MKIKIDNNFLFEIPQDLVKTDLINEVLNSYQYLFWEEGWADGDEEPIRYSQDIEHELSEWIKNNLTYENNTKVN